MADFSLASSFLQVSASFSSSAAAKEVCFKEENVRDQSFSETELPLTTS